MGLEINGIYREESYELPISAVREMIANAVLHRSYLDRSCVQVCIFDDRIEVLSPGTLYGGLDIATAKTGKSTCRNEAIAEAFHYMHIVEAWGTGIPRIISRCKEYGLPEPLFEEFGDGFKVTIFRKTGNTTKDISNTPEKVSNTLQKTSNKEQKTSNAFEKYAKNTEKGTSKRKGYCQNSDGAWRIWQRLFWTKRCHEFVEMFKINRNQSYEYNEKIQYY